MIGTWCDRHVPSAGLPSTSFGPVQPLGVRRMIIGHAARGRRRPLRAARWISRDLVERVVERGRERLMHNSGLTPATMIGSRPESVHQAFAAALDDALDEIREIQRAAREDGMTTRPRWPMIILRTPKGWTGPKEVDGLPVEGTWRSHQVPITDVRDNVDHLRLLEEWLRSYRPEELFDDGGHLVPELAELPPRGDRRMSANPHANGGELLRDLILPDFRDYAVEVPKPGTTLSEATRVLGASCVTSSRPTGTTSASSGRTRRPRTGSDDVFSVTNKAWEAEIEPTDENLAPEGRVVEVLSEHLCQGWLEGYLLTGRHGLFNCYEAFIHIVDSMFNQHAKWLKVTRHIPWRRPIASLNYLLSSHVWRQDHNGFSHQDPGFIDHVVNKKAEVIRVYLPPDANTLLSVADHCLRSRNYVNVIVAGKQPALNYLSMDDAIVHCTRGAGIWEWASNDDDGYAGRRARLLRRHPHARDARGCGATARASPRAEGAGRQRRRPDAACSRTPSTRTGSPTTSSTRSSPPTGRSCSPTTATRG